MSNDALQSYGYEQQLKRTLGFWQVVAYGMIFVCPMAAMTVYGYVAQTSNGMDSLVYIIGLAAMFFTALSYGKMIRQFPLAGSVYTYVQRAVNPHVGFLAGWLILIDYALIPAFITAFAGLWVNMLLPAVPIWLAIAVFVVWNTVMNILGVEFGAKIHFTLLGLQGLAILAFVVVGIAYIAGGGARLTLDPIYQAGKINLDFIAAATSVAIVSFLGFDAMTTLAEETQDAPAVIPRAIPTTLILLGFVFLVQTYVASLIHPGSEGLNPDTAFFDIATVAAGGGQWLQNGLLIVLILALGVGVAFVSQSAAARILFSMGRDQIIPGFFGRVQSRFQTPSVALIFMGLLTFVLAVALSIETLISLVNFGALTSFMILNLAVIWFFYVKKGGRSLQDTLHYLLFPGIGFLIITYVWYGLDSVTKVAGLVWLAVGLLIGATKSKGYKEVPDALKHLGL